MANTVPEAIDVANGKIRPAATRFIALYNFYKELQVQGQVLNYLALFPANNEVIVDGAEVDGRHIITNQNVRDFIADFTAFINFVEANTNAVRNRAITIAVNPEQS